MGEETTRSIWPRAFVALSILLAVASSCYLVYSGLGESGYFLPTYDNAMLMAARAQVVLTTGHWAEYNLVFGGITKSYQQPLAPAIAAGLSAITGLNLWWAIRLMSMLVTGLLLPLSLYCLGRQVSGKWVGGVASALAGLSLASLMTWGTRTSPDGIGVVLVAFGLYFVAKDDYWLAGLVGISLALSHPPSCLSFGLAIGAYYLLLFLTRFAGSLKGGVVPAFTTVFKENLPLFSTGAVTLATFLAWHIRQTGLACLNFSCLPQVGAHEYGTSVDLFSYLLSEPASLLGVAGAACLALWGKMSFQHKLLLLGWLGAMVMLVKNDSIGVDVFTQRFLTYFDESLAVLAGVFVAWVYSLASGFLEGKRQHGKCLS